ncbi:uncharacterized protein LOC135805732 [Sycon ciliatum]|uniref:uncharacterized protein LOC135805732 n=1 Tax=Sycon ciliatum TaxID=27933 RepID=UPI0031F70FCA
MPRFIGQDFIEDASAYRRVLIQRMGVDEPVHLDEIEGYPHQGLAAEVNTLSLPWCLPPLPELGFAEPSSTTSLANEFCKLSCFQSDHCSGIITAPNFSDIAEETSVASSLFVDPSSPLSPSIDRLVEEACDDVCRDILEFPCGDFVTTDDWESFADGYSPLYFEEVLPASELCDGTYGLPSLNALSARLKQKQVSDPLVDSQGKLPTLSSMVFSTSRDICADDGALDTLALCTLQRDSCVLDDIEHEILYEEDDAIDTVMDLTVPTIDHSASPPLNSRSCSDVMKQLQLQSDSGLESSSCTEELEELVKFSGGPEVLSPEARVDSKSDSKYICTDEALIDDSDAIHNRMQMFEEPMSPDGNVARCGQVGSISCLEMARVVCQPYLKPLAGVETGKAPMMILSPESKLIAERGLIEANSRFDEESVHMLTVPVVSCNLLLQRRSALDELRQCFPIEEWRISSEADLQLTWDPLAGCIEEMKACQLKTESVSGGYVDWQADKVHAKLQKRMETALQQLYDTEKAVLPASYVAGDGHLGRISTGCSTGKPVYQSTTSHSERHLPTSEAPRDYDSGSQASNFPMLPIQPGASLDNFLLLRDVPDVSTSSEQVCSSQAGTHSKVDASKSAGSTLRAVPSHDSDELRHSAAKVTGATTNSKGPSVARSIKYVRMEGVFLQLYNRLRSQAQVLLLQIQSQRSLLNGVTMDTISVDQVLFFVNSWKQDDDEESSTHGNYLVRLLCILETCDSLLQCSLPTAICSLGKLREKHSQCLKGGLQSLATELFESHCQFQDQSVMHPKITALINALNIG